MNLFRTMILLIICSMMLICCGKRHVQIDRDTKRAIDTLAAKQANAMRPVLDSICQLKMDSLVATMSDSVMMARREEMRKLLGR